MLTLICGTCTRFRISPELQADARDVLESARAHCWVTGHCVSVSEPGQVFVFKRLRRTVLLERRGKDVAA